MTEAFKAPLRATRHCRHYSYEIGKTAQKSGPCCARGLDLRARPGTALACMPLPAAADYCALREEFTVGEREAWAAWEHEHVVRMVRAAASLPAPIEPGAFGRALCPNCGGVLTYSRWETGAAVTCSTEGCCAWRMSMAATAAWPHGDVSPKEDREREAHKRWLEMEREARASEKSGREGITTGFLDLDAMRTNFRERRSVLTAVGEIAGVQNGVTGTPQQHGGNSVSASHGDVGLNPKGFDCFAGGSRDEPFDGRDVAHQHGLQRVELVFNELEGIAVTITHAISPSNNRRVDGSSRRNGDQEESGSSDSGEAV